MIGVSTAETGTAITAVTEGIGSAIGMANAGIGTTETEAAYGGEVGKLCSYRDSIDMVWAPPSR